MINYNDIVLIPKMGVINTRKEADTRVRIGNNVFNLPIIPANMKCTIDESIAKWMSENEYFYIMHRFDIDILEFVKKANEENWKNISISIGVKDSDYKIINKIEAANLRVDYITIDIAHGHSTMMMHMLEHVKKHMLHTCIIAGNIATIAGAHALKQWGANIIKVGIGGGSVCSTKFKTGFTNPMFSCVKDIAENVDIPIIADGGIVHNGDIAKAIVAGADMIMAGGIFTQCIDSPTETTMINGQLLKKYYGSASAENKGHSNNVEGFTTFNPVNGMTYYQKLLEIEQDLQSAISYAGGTTLNALKYVEWRKS